MAMEIDESLLINKNQCLNCGVCVSTCPAKVFVKGDRYVYIDNKQKKYNKFISAIVPEPNFNYMSDLIELPTTTEHYKWLLVVVDLATNLFDIEPMKNK